MELVAQVINVSKVANLHLCEQLLEVGQVIIIEFIRFVTTFYVMHSFRPLMRRTCLYYFFCFRIFTMPSMPNALNGLFTVSQNSKYVTFKKGD